MVELTASARRCLDGYLAEVRSALRRCPAVDAEEVERDVLDHVEQALDGRPPGISASELRLVLDRLGRPARWVPREDLGRVQRALLALRTGPEDLRLAYLCCAAAAGTLLGCCCLNLWIGPAGTLPFLALGLAAAFVLGRASIAAAPDLAAAERWLIYPALLLVYAPVVLASALVPIAAGIAVELFLIDLNSPWSSRNMSCPPGTVAAVAVAVLGPSWWGSFLLAAWRWPAAVRGLLAPFADGFARDRALLLVGGGGLLISAAAVVAACLTVGTRGS